MIAKYYAALMALPLLTGCFADNPDNIPLRGDWEMTTRLDSLTIDGMIVPPEQLPREIRAIEETDNRCGEPVFTDRSGEQNVLDWRVGGDCRFEAFDVDGARVTTNGSCSAVGGIDTFNPRFDVSVVQREHSYRMVVNMEGSAEIPGQGSHYIRLIAVQQGTRTGDC